MNTVVTFSEQIADSRQKQFIHVRIYVLLPINFTDPYGLWVHFSWFIVPVELLCDGILSLLQLSRFWLHFLRRPIYAQGRKLGLVIIILFITTRYIGHSIINFVVCTKIYALAYKTLSFSTEYSDQWILFSFVWGFFFVKQLRAVKSIFEYMKLVYQIDPQAQSLVVLLNINYTCV